jgi:hypothetical protein
MQTYRCTCGNRLFFENTQCIACHAEVGWCEGCHRITTLEPEGDQLFRCGYPDCQQPLVKCHNYAVEDVCNRCFVSTSALAASTSSIQAPLPPQSPGPPPALPSRPSPPADGAVAEATVLVGIDPATLCTACQLTETIPDLNIPGHREKWARLESAKRRLLYTLDRLSLPYAYAEPRLSFDFKADVEPPSNDWRDAGPEEIVYTGHADGKITINLREADDAEREKLRVTFHEAHRTLIGHLHHEVGHYYWQLLVEGKCERDFQKLFGGHANLSYADAMAAYYQNGPREGWPGSFISAYASAHPWEDFAETFALYLDIIAVLDTASHLFKSIRANFRGRSVKPLVERYQEIGILENEFNRTMGLIDLVPEVIVPPVVAKLEFIHKIVKGAGKQRRKKSAAGPALAASVPALMQEGSMGFEPAIVVGGRD